MDSGFVAPAFADWQARADSLELKRQGRELVGPCPSCGGTDRFAVKPVDAGGAIFNCRQCQGFVDILRAAGLTEERRDRTNGHREPETTYVYRGPDGEPYHRVFRRGSGPNKAIRQSPGFKGRFHPYRIEEAADWGERPVVVVEGERCVEHLARLGYATVTWCGGTGAVARTDWDALAGRAAVLWADNDAPGAKAMQTVAGALAALDCPVRHVQIPEGKPSGWDCADATESEAHRLIETAGDVARPIEEVGGQLDEWPRAMTPEEFMTADFPQPGWLLDGVLPNNGVCLIASPPDSGKSTTLRSLTYAVARGQTFLGKSVRQGPVWYGGFEEDPARSRIHFQTMGFDGAQPIHPWIGFPPGELDPYEWLDAEIRRVKPALAVVDTLSDLLRIEDESKYAEVRNKMRPLMAMARTQRTCILIAHHVRKGSADHWTDRVMGSQGFRASVDTTLLIDWTNERRTLRSVGVGVRWIEDNGGSADGAGTVLAGAFPISRSSV